MISREVVLPFLHPNVDLADLHPNRKLLAEDEIATLTSVMQDFPDGRYRKKDHRIRKKFPTFASCYGIIKFDDSLFVIYKGRKHQKHVYCDDDNSKKVKLAQELKTGAWYVLKTEANPQPALLQAEDNRFITNDAAFRRQFDNVKSEVDNINTFGNDRLHIVGSLMQRATTVRDRKYPEYSCGKVTYSFLMPLLPGLSLSTFLARQFKLPTFRWLDIALKMLRELNALHKRGLLHRDIKLENMMYDFFRHEITVIDFEFMQKMNAAGQHIGMLSGTMLHLAPELIKYYQDQHVDQPLEGYHYNEFTEAYALGIALKILFGLPVREVPDIKKISAEEFSKRKFFMMGHDRNVKHIAPLLNLLQNLTADDPARRDLRKPHAENALSLFEGIIETLEPIQADIIKQTTLKTAVIEADAVLKLFRDATPRQRDRVLKILQQFDEICLVSLPDVVSDAYFQLLQIQRCMFAAKVDLKIPLYKNLLVLPKVDALPELVAYFKNQDTKEFPGHAPQRSLTYLCMNGYMSVASQVPLLQKGFHVLEINDTKPMHAYFTILNDCNETMKTGDYDFLKAAIEMECQRLQSKYDLDTHRSSLLPIEKGSKISLAEHRYTLLKATLEQIIKLNNVRLSYAAVSTLLKLVESDSRFRTAPTRFFARKNSTCVMNVKNIQAGLEQRRVSLSR